MANHTATFITKWVKVTDNLHSPAITVDYNYTWSDVTGTEGNLLAQMPVAIVAVQYSGLTDEQFETMRADERYLLWSSESYDDDGALIETNWDTPITVNNIQGIVTKLTGWGITELGGNLGQLVTGATQAASAGQPLTRKQVESSVLAALRNPV